MKLPVEFYERKEVVKIARELLGKGLFVQSDTGRVGGMIVETEAYSWKERGCHAYGRKRTARNEIMFATGGHVYVYLCYGIHNMFNVVTNREGIAEAVLVRALQPLDGLIERVESKSKAGARRLTSGPGKLTKAMGINRTFNGKYLIGNEIWIEDLDVNPTRSQVVASPRIGIDYAGEDAKLLWRFSLKKNEWVSK